MKKACWISVPILLMAACLCFGFFEKEKSPPPVPPDVTYAAPEPALPTLAGALAGKWVGRWNSTWGWDVVLYIEKLEKDTAQVVYAWGDYKTNMGSCHCNPNWVRVQNARVTYADGSATIDFYTPKLRPGWLRKSHLVTGSADELYGAHDKSSGRYSYHFVLDQNDPTVITGRFISAKASHLSIKMKKADPDKETER